MARTVRALFIYLLLKHILAIMSRCFDFSTRTCIF